MSWGSCWGHSAGSSPPVVSRKAHFLHDYPHFKEAQALRCCCGSFLWADRKAGRHATHCGCSPGSWEVAELLIHHCKEVPVCPEKSSEGAKQKAPCAPGTPQHRKVKSSISRLGVKALASAYETACYYIALYNLQLHLGLHWACRTGTITRYKCVHTPMVGFSKGSCEQLFGFTDLTHTFQIAAHRFKIWTFNCKIVFCVKVRKEPHVCNVHVGMCV